MSAVCAEECYISTFAIFKLGGLKYGAGTLKRPPFAVNGGGRGGFGSRSGFSHTKSSFAAAAHFSTNK